MIRYKIHKKRIEQLSQQKASKIDRQKCIECTRNRTLKKKLKSCEACKFNSWSFGTCFSRNFNKNEAHICSLCE